MKIKKVLSMVLAVVLVLGMLPMSVFAAYTDGTYTKTVTVEPDENGDFTAYELSVDLTVADGVITNVAYSEGNTYGVDEWEAEDNWTYCNRAMNGRGSKVGVAAQIVENNGVEGVDVVSTATCTSNAIIEAVSAILAEITEPEEAPVVSGYVLMNIPYEEFYAAEGVSDVDAVTTATVKTYNQNMAGGSYHEGYAAADPISDAKILGVTYPVYVEDMSVLAGLTEVNAESTATITVASGKSSTVEKEVSGVDLLFASGTYAYYVLAEVPTHYKTLTVNGGDFSFSAVNGSVTAASGMEVELVYGAHYTDIEFNVTAAEITDTCTVNAITLTTSDGNEYALRHVEDIWRKTSLGWNWDSLDGNGLSGKTITKVTYYIQDNGAYAIYTYDVNATLKLNPGTVTAAFEDANTIVLTGLPTDIENATATVKTKVGRGETATVIAENVAVVNGTIVTTDAAVTGTYVITIVSDNYGDISVNADYVEKEIPTEPEEPTEPEQPTEPEEPTEPEQPTQPENSDAPQTGDSNQLMLWSSLMLLSLACMGLILMAQVPMKKRGKR